MSVRYRVAPVAATVLAVLLAGCAPAVVPTPTPTVPPPLPTVSFAQVSSADVPGLSTQTQSDESAHVHTIVPQIEGQDALNAELKGFADMMRSDFAEATAQDTDHAGFLDVNWATLGSGRDIIGFLLTGSLNPGASTNERLRTVWYDTTGEKLLDLNDFVTDAGMTTVSKDVQRALTAHVIGADLDQAQRTLAAGDAAVGFDAKGALLVGFDAYSVAAGSYGAPLIATSVDESQLTSAGRTARDAMLHPQQLQITLPPRPAERRDIDCAVVKCVALTFDDGPSSQTTPGLLDILNNEDVRATFFVLGSQVQAFPNIAAREVSDGHEVGNHSWSHPDLSELSVQGIRDQVDRTQTLIEQVTGEKPVLFRPPYGAHNAAVDKVLADAGYAEVFWSVDTLDWKHHDPVKSIAAAAAAKPGAIVLMHDIHATTVSAVPGVIAALRAKGYTFVTVSELFGGAEPGRSYYGTY